MKPTVRTRTYYCGETYIESECFIAPMHAFRHSAHRIKSGNDTTLKQQRCNKRNRLKHFLRLVLSNFGSGKDWFVTLTYNNSFLPRNEAIALYEAREFMRRLKGHCKRRGHEFRMMIITERGKGGRLHHHAFVSCNVPKELIEKAWAKKGVCGGQKQSMGHIAFRQLPSDTAGLKEVAAYSLKSTIGKHNWIATKNLYKPVIKTEDNALRYSDFARLGYGSSFTSTETWYLLSGMYPGFNPVIIDGYIVPSINTPYLRASFEREKG